MRYFKICIGIIKIIRYAKVKKKVLVLDIFRLVFEN